MSVVIQVEYHKVMSPAIRKWIQRHPELRSDFYYGSVCHLLRFNIGGHDFTDLVRVYDYFSRRSCNVFHIKRVDPETILANYEIISHRPFKAVPRREKDVATGTDRANRPGDLDLSEVAIAGPRGQLRHSVLASRDLELLLRKEIDR